MKIGSSILISIMVLGLALPAWADTTLRYQVSRGGNTVPMVLKARAGEIRVQGAAMGGRFQWMVYRSADDTLYAVDPQQKTFLTLDSAAIEVISQRLDALRADLRERLERMPVGQRKFVESQIGEFLKEPKGKRATAEIDMGDDKAEVNDVACRKGRIISRGQPVGELCVASADALGLTNAELAAYRGLYALINELQATMSSDAAKAPDISALSGVAVSMRIEPSGIVQRLERITHEPLRDDVFEIPAGYQRREPQDLLQ